MQLAKIATAHGLRVNSVCPHPSILRYCQPLETMTDEIIDWAIDTGAGRVATAEDQAKRFSS